MPYCNNCGQQNPEGAPFCNYCGAVLNAQQNQMQNPQQLMQNNPQQKPKKKKNGCLIAILVVLGLSLLSAITGNHRKETNQDTTATKEPSVTTTASIIETEPVTTASETTAPEESSTEILETTEDIHSIRIVADEENEYSEEYTLNAGTDLPDTNIVYFLPAGRYEVTNTGKNRNQFNVYSRETHIVDGWEEPLYTPVVELLDVGESAEIEIPEDHYIEIHGGEFELIPIQ